MTLDQELIRRAAAAWERHSAGPRISGGHDGDRREFVAGYCAREAELRDSAGDVAARIQGILSDPSAVPEILEAAAAIARGEFILDADAVRALRPADITAPSAPSPGAEAG